MSKYQRKNTDKTTYSDPIILKGRVVSKGKLHKPFKNCRNRIEIKIQVTVSGITKIYNSEAWGDVAYSIHRRIKSNDIVIAVGQHKITKTYYSEKKNFNSR